MTETKHEPEKRMFYVFATSGVKNGQVVAAFLTDLAAQNYCITYRYNRIATMTGEGGTDKASKADIKAIAIYIANGCR